MGLSSRLAQIEPSRKIIARFEMCQNSDLAIKEVCIYVCVYDRDVSLLPKASFLVFANDYRS